nr:EOG090X0P1V [Eurycercus lamellatus]
MEYEAVVKGALRLKGTANKEIQKKGKKKNKDKIKNSIDSKSNESNGTNSKQDLNPPQSQKQAIVKTKAQLKFEQMKEEQQKKRILEKASKTHKQRVEEFNRHLDSLTEHFDIPKVSWTK